MTLEKLEEQLAGLSRSEKAALVQRLIQDLVYAWPGIEKIPGVAGGDACVVRTRIPVWALENYRRLGWNEARLLDNFPTLHASDLVNAWAYVDAHTDEIDESIRVNQAA